MPSNLYKRWFVSDELPGILENILSIIQTCSKNHTYTFTQSRCNLNSLNMCVASLKCKKNMPAINQLDIHIIPRYLAIA